MVNQLAITGIGVISPIGSGIEEFWTNMLGGNSGIKPTANLTGEGIPCKIAAEISDFRVTDYLEMKGLRYLDRTGQMALSAAYMALNHSRFTIGDDQNGEVGIALGNTFGSWRSITDFDLQALTEGYAALNPADFANTVINAAAGNIAIKLGTRGPNLTIAAGITSSLDALGYCLDTMESNGLQLHLCGGVEEISRPLLRYYAAAGVLGEYTDTDEAKGFIEHRRGLIPGEGAVFFTLETVVAAKSRGASIYAKICGYSRGTDIDGTGDNAVTVIENCLRESKKEVQDIDMIVTGFNGTVIDEIEASALQKVFGERLNHIEQINVKRFIGETYSAAGVFSILGALGWIYTKGLSREPARTKSTILINGFGDNGCNTAVVIEK